MGDFWRNEGLTISIQNALSDGQPASLVFEIIEQVNVEIERLTVEQTELDREALDPMTSTEAVDARRKQSEEIGFQIKRLKASVEKLREEFAVAQERDEQEMRSSLYARATDLMTSAGKAIETKAEALAAELRLLLESGAEALKAMNAANSILPNGAKPIVAHPAVAQLQLVPEQVLSRREVELWFNEHSGAVVAENLLVVPWGDTIESLRKVRFAQIQFHAPRAVFRKVIETTFIPAHRLDWLADDKGKPAAQSRYETIAEPDRDRQHVHRGGKIRQSGATI